MEKRRKDIKLNQKENVLSVASDSNHHTLGLEFGDTLINTRLEAKEEKVEDVKGNTRRTRKN